MGKWWRLLALTTIGLCFAVVSAFGGEEVIRVKLLAHRGNHLQVRTASGDQRRVKLSQKVVIVSHDKATMETKKIVRNSTLLLTLNNGEVTTVVIEEVPK